MIEMDSLLSPRIPASPLSHPFFPSLPAHPLIVSSFVFNYIIVYTHSKIFIDFVTYTGIMGWDKVTYTQFTRVTVQYQFKFQYFCNI